MMNIKKKSRVGLAAILVSALVFSMSFGALATEVLNRTSETEPTVTLSDSGNKAVFSINRTDTDLFDQFKAVMPGDILTQTVTVRTTAGNSSNYNIYLYAREHSTETSEKESKASKFLEQLKITVSMDGRTMDLMAAGEGTKGVHLGEFSKSGESKDILVTLDVPIEMGNEFKQAEASVDWFFYAQGINEGGGGGNDGGGGGGHGGGGGGDDPKPDPDTPPVVTDLEFDITDDEVPLGELNAETEEELGEFDIPDEEIPLGALEPVGDIPQTGDENNMMLWAVLFVLSGGMLVFLLTGLKKAN